MSASTTIIIPGRETQTIPGIVLTKSDVIASFAGDIDLGRMDSTEEKTETGVVITFSNRTGTKGAGDIHLHGDISVQVEGDVVINTRIEIPGREAQVIPGILLAKDQVVASFAGEIDLGGMDCSESVEDDTRVVTFSNRTGTKGATSIVDVIQAALLAAAQDSSVEDDDEDEFYEEDEEDFGDDEEVTGTIITIPGREVQVIQGMVLDASMVKGSFAGEIDLSGYDVTETERNGMLEVTFTARTGTKGEA